MDRFVIKKPKTKSTDEYYFAGNKVIYSNNTATVTEEVIYASKVTHAYIFTSKAKALKVKATLKSKSAWKIELYKEVK